MQRPRQCIMAALHDVQTAAIEQRHPYLQQINATDSTKRQLGHCMDLSPADLTPGNLLCALRRDDPPRRVIRMYTLSPILRRCFWYAWLGTLTKSHRR